MNFVGTQLYGWSQVYQQEKKNLAEHMNEVLSAVRDGGFDFVEGFLDVGRPENNTAFADRLRAKGMRPVSLYTGGRLHDQEKADEAIGQLLAAAKVCQAAGYLMLNCNPDPIGRAKTDAELKVQAASLDKLAAGLNELDMILGVHNHTPEMADDAREFHHNFRNTDGGKVGFCFDVHWVYRGGLAPRAALNEYHDRIVSWHLRQSRDKIWLEDLADGDVDYQEIADFIVQHEFHGPYIVELAIENGTKITRTVAENNQRSRQYVKKVFGV